MKFRNLITAALSSAALLACSATAYAGEALIQGVGFWGAGTPVTDYSAPNESFLFSFDVPNPLDANPTSDITNFLYQLNGSSVSATPTAVEFFDLTKHGMFDIDFADHTVSIFGPDIGSTGVLSPSGFYNVTAGMDDAFPGTATGGVTLTVTPVPEASAWAMMLAGVALIGGMLRWRPKMAAAAA